VIGLQNFFESLSINTLEEIDDIGPIVANSINNWFSNPKNKELLKELSSVGVILTKASKGKTNKIFDGMVFVLTGSLKNVSRQEAKDIIEERGGKVHSNISPKTNVVVLGENPGSKYKRALSLKIKIWNENQFISKINNNNKKI